MQLNKKRLTEMESSIVDLLDQICPGTTLAPLPKQKSSKKPTKKVGKVITSEQKAQMLSEIKYVIDTYFPDEE